MFTGLVQAIGHLYHRGQTHLEIHCSNGSTLLLQDMTLGDSIAVDGVCLTVESLLDEGFIASASPETLRRSTLGYLPDAAPVNLESSLRAGGKIGGHFVTGHVDGIGHLEQQVQTSNAWEMRFSVTDAVVARYIVHKGSIAVNGVSLTVADCDTAASWFTVAVIPVTYQETNLQMLAAGQAVNLEGDILGKYVEKFLLTPTAGQAQGRSPCNASPNDSLTMEFLT